MGAWERWVLEEGERYRSWLYRLQPTAWVLVGALWQGWSDRANWSLLAITLGGLFMWAQMWLDFERNQVLRRNRLSPARVRAIRIGVGFLMTVSALCLALFSLVYLG